MTTADLISLIDAQIEVLKQARALLDASAKRKPGRPKAYFAPTPKTTKGSNLSAEGRARISAAVKARWARQKKAAKA